MRALYLNIILIILSVPSVYGHYQGQLSGQNPTLWSLHIAPFGTDYMSVYHAINPLKDAKYKSWDKLSTGVTKGLIGIWFTSDSVGYAYDTSDIIIKAIELCTNWLKLPSKVTVDLLDIKVISNSIDFSGAYSNELRILRTTDVRISLSTVSSIHLLFDSTFVDSYNGYIRVVSGMKRINGGLKWIVSAARNKGGTTRTLIEFIDRMTGYLAGQSENIHKTTNRGTTWTYLSSGNAQFLNGVNCKNDFVGYDPKNRETLLKTSDAGLNFNSQSLSNKSSFRDISVTNNYFLVSGLAAVIFPCDSSLTYESVWFENFQGINNSIANQRGCSVNTDNNTKGTWRLDNPNSRNGLTFTLDPPFAMFDSQWYVTTQDASILDSPTFYLSDFTDLSLLKVEAFLPDFQGQVNVKIEDWYDSNWVIIYRSNGRLNSFRSRITVTASYSFTQVRRSIDMSALVGEREAKIRFTYFDNKSSTKFRCGTSNIKIRDSKMNQFQLLIGQTPICNINCLTMN